MKAGDLVKHIGFGKIFLVAKNCEQTGAMVAVFTDNGVRWMAKSWLEIVSES